MSSPTQDTPPVTAAPAARRMVARLLDILPAVVLFAVIYVTGLDRLGDVDGCEEVPSDRCEIVTVERTRDEVGGEKLVYVLRSGRVVPADQDTIAVAGTTLLVDPPPASSYVPSFVYAMLALGLLPGRTGWTPGRYLLRLRVVGPDGRPDGPAASLRAWALPDGAIALTALVAVRVGAPWPVGAAVALSVLPVTGWILDRTTHTTRDITVRAADVAARHPAAEPDVPAWDDPVWHDHDVAEVEPADVEPAHDDDPLEPRWDVDRQAFIAWDPDLGAWRQWDDELGAWGPLED